MENRRVEVSLGVEPVGAQPKQVFPLRIRDCSRAVERREVAPADIELSVQSGGLTLLRADFDDPAQLATVLGVITARQDTHRLYIVRINRWCKCRRTVLRQRKSVDYILNVVLRAPWMQYSIGLVKPSRRLVDEVRKISARLCGDLLSDCPLPDGIDGARPAEIYKRRRLTDLDVRRDRRQAHRHREVHGYLGPNFD